MFALPMSLADVVVFNGHALGFHFNITRVQLIEAAIAVMVGLLAEFVTGWRLRFGLIGAIIAAFIGIWLLTDIIIINLPWDWYLYEVPIFKALVGAVLAVIIWHWLTYRTHSRNSRTARRSTRRRSRRQSQRYS